MTRPIKIFLLLAAFGLALGLGNFSIFTQEADTDSRENPAQAPDYPDAGAFGKGAPGDKQVKVVTDEAGEEPLALHLPPGMEDRVKLWELVYGEYDSSQLIFYHRDYPGIIYEVVLDFPRRKGKAMARIRERLYKLDRIEKKSSDPKIEIEKSPDAPELLALYKKFEAITGKDKFAQAARRDTIGVLRGRKNELADAFLRAGPYLAAMERIFEDHGLPRELTRIVFVESMFERGAASSKKAHGVWQVLPGSAKPYLVITRAVDERRDPIASTRAAAQILKSNYERLGSWPLAVTAYNAGTARMKKAVEHTGTDSLPELLDQYDHRAIGFSVENFYTKVLGVVRAEKRLGPVIKKSNYGLSPLEYDLISLSRSYYLQALSRKLGMAPEMLITMNPAWTERVEKNITPIPKSYLLRIPKGSKSVVRETLNIPKTSTSSTPSKNKVATAQ